MAAGDLQPHGIPQWLETQSRTTPEWWLAAAHAPLVVKRERKGRACGGLQRGAADGRKPSGSSLI
ncbi:hypothetical protein P7K49_021057 [Saguinus oedipus]|uniref:Uncharacterized protein n=1 Tax=Saguinus oedipus TaxID=9490 RepID=A0ABQ9URJ5_SAGOE|nr:hypothetical protein P7K49_021057 [Saguinus oedipus]